MTICRSKRSRRGPSISRLRPSYPGIRFYRGSRACWHAVWQSQSTIQASNLTLIWCRCHRKITTIRRPPMTKLKLTIWYIVKPWKAARYSKTIDRRFTSEAAVQMPFPRCRRLKRRRWVRSGRKTSSRKKKASFGNRAKTYSRAQKKTVLRSAAKLTNCCRWVHLWRAPSVLRHSVRRYSRLSLDRQ